MSTNADPAGFRYKKERCPKTRFVGRRPIGSHGFPRNDKIKFPNRPGSSYGWVTSKGGKASDCIECGACEAVCPQHLPIRDLLKQAAAQFE